MFKVFSTALLVASFQLVASVAAEEGAADETKHVASSPLEIEAIELSPEKPAADTLCQLSVKLRNAGQKPISGLELGVRIGGKPLVAYERQVFMDELPAGATTDLRLFNFWTTEGERPAPASGKLTLEVSVRSASWLEVSRSEDGTETWTLLDVIPGLPVARQLEIALGKTP